MVGTGKLLAVGYVTSCCSAYISGRQPVSPPLASEILDGEDVCKKKNKKTRRFQLAVRCVLYDIKTYTTDGALYDTCAYISYAEHTTNIASYDTVTEIRDG